MEFLYKLYENQYFALILFSVIAVLLLFFVIVLFVALKDSKNKKEENLNRLEEEKIIEEHDNVDEFSFKDDSVAEKLQNSQEIVFDEPVGKNSMENLLNSFEKTNLDVPEDDDLDNLIEKISVKKEEDNVSEKELNNNYVKVINEDDSDDFELPAMKVSNEEDSNENFISLDDDIPEVKVEDLKSENIDLSKTGVLNFTNIETESYDIQK